MISTGEFENLLPESAKESQQIRVYGKRWLMLGLCFLYSIANCIQMSQYTIIATLVAKYYDVSYLAVNWTALISTITYVLFSLPGGYILSKLGLRMSVLVGITGTCFGAWLKVIAVQPTLFWLAFTGQTIASVFQVLVLPIPPKLAGVWFSKNEVGTACGIGIMGIQVGGGLGFLLPSLIVNSGTMEEIGDMLYMNVIGIAAFSTTTAVLLFYFFKEAPLSPPSVSTAKAMESQSSQTSFKTSVANLSSNKSFLIFVLIMAISFTSSTPLLVMINEIVLNLYPDTTIKVGILGVLYLALSIVGSFAGGIILDKFKNYRTLTLYSLIFQLVALTSVNFLISQGLWILFILMSLLGFLQGLMLTIEFETGVELTYPQSEEISSGFLSTVNQLCIPLLTNVFTIVYSNFGFQWAFPVICLIVFSTDLLFFCVKFNLKRQEEQQLHKLQYSEFNY